MVAAALFVAQIHIDTIITIITLVALTFIGFRTKQKLEEIHLVVNSRLDRTLKELEELKGEVRDRALKELEELKGEVRALERHNDRTNPPAGAP